MIDAYITWLRHVSEAYPVAFGVGLGVFVGVALVWATSHQQED